MTHTTQYRADIDGLRAVAVLAVIVFHYWDFPFPSGYLGVDVFFVISGYVITAYLSAAEKITWADFLLTFYVRRIKRLMPALVVCVVVSSILFALVTTHAPKEAFLSGAWSLVGFSNVYLLNESRNYFALDAELIPFTHTWSLGVEEQFYLVYPALIAYVGYSWRERRQTIGRAAAAIFVLSAASFCFYLFLRIRSPIAAFYLMPSRFWELGAGGLTYFATASRPTFGGRWVANVSMLGVVGCFLTPSSWTPVTLPLCVALTASLILANGRAASMASKALSLVPVVGLGRISYSLYLWHWTTLVIGKWTFGDSSVLSPILLALATLFATASYFFIEAPLRRADWTSSKARTLAVGVSASFGAFLFVDRVMPNFAKHYDANLPSLVGVPAPAAWRPNPCNGREAVSKLRDPLTFCLAADRGPAKPHILYLLGDSHAAQLFEMSKLATADLPFIARFINLEDVNEFVVGLTRGVRQSKLLNFVLDNGKRGDAVVIAFYRGHLNPSRDRHVPLGESVSIGAFGANFVAAMGPYVDKMVESGMQVFLVADTPQMRANAPSSSCALQIKLFGSSICRVTKAQDLQTRRRQDLAFDALEKRDPDSVFTWDPIDDIYGRSDQIDVLDDRGHYVMLDWNHLTEERAERLAPSFRAFLIKHGALVGYTP
jgi:peptidoglycan/LPS O-acetylase OafA/YrhL